MKPFHNQQQRTFGEGQCILLGCHALGKLLMEMVNVVFQNELKQKIQHAKHFIYLVSFT